MNRRSLLAAAVTGLSLPLVGCSSSDDGADDTGETDGEANGGADDGDSEANGEIDGDDHENGADTEASETGGHRDQRFYIVNRTEDEARLTVRIRADEPVFDAQYSVASYESTSDSVTLNGDGDHEITVERADGTTATHEIRSGSDEDSIEIYVDRDEISIVQPTMD